MSDYQQEEHDKNTAKDSLETEDKLSSIESIMAV